MKLRLWLLLVVVALFAVPSFAQLQYQQLRSIDSDPDTGGWSGVSSSRTGMYLDNPCTAVQDLVYVDYSAYVEGLQTEQGGDRFVFDESTTVSGSYSASGTSQSDVGYLPPYSLRKYYKVNTYDDFHVVTVINFDPSYKTTNVTVETACGNGMPDSKE
jgi:hypothetical protein